MRSHPILSCAAARDFEQQLFEGDEGREWSAMQQAGRAIAAAVRRDFGEIGGFPPAGRVLVLAGKGHNGGDALIAAQALLEGFPEARAEVVFAFGSRVLRPLAARAWRELAQRAGGRVTAATEIRGQFDLCLDGVFGFQFRAPADARTLALLENANAAAIRMRVAVDLPSAGVFRADFTYATGSVKEPVLAAPTAGRVRYLDLGFFRVDETGEHRVLTPGVLAALRGWRAPASDKRTYGHVLIVGGSGGYPGAVLMSVLAALRSGAGLVTALVPESLVPAFAARAPEAMWVGWPQTPTGGLALEGEHLLRARLDRGTALVLGPGLGREPETLALAASIVATSPLPLVIDADALQPEIVRAGTAARILTPHAGEFARIEAAVPEAATLVLKGPVTRITQGAGLSSSTGAERGRKRSAAAGVVYHSFFGGPVLARGGSGDVLAGLIGGLLAQTPADPVLAAARGVVWHGLAADALAQARGSTAVTVTELLEHLPGALRGLKARLYVVSNCPQRPGQALACRIP